MPRRPDALRIDYRYVILDGNDEVVGIFDGSTQGFEDAYNKVRELEKEFDQRLKKEFARNLHFPRES